MAGGWGIFGTSANRRQRARASAIISYPKTGRTWLRTMLGKVLVSEAGLADDRILDTRYASKRAGIEQVTFDHDGSEMLARHPVGDLAADKSSRASDRVVLLSRDVRDTLVSAYFQATRRINVYDGPISDFIRSDVFGAIKVLTFYRQWYEARDVPVEFMFIRYEDLHLDTAAVLRDVLKFIGLERCTDAQTIQGAIEYGSFSNMRKVEASQTLATADLAPGDPADSESYKVRRGKIGGYRAYLSPTDIDWIDGMIREHGCPFTNYDGEAVFEAGIRGT